MNAQTYIESRLKALKQSVLSLDADRGESLKDTVTKLTLSKKFRKYSVDEDFKRHLDGVIDACVIDNKPIPFVWDFGGYKLWRLEESPEVDWAELFSLIHFASWLLPVALIYKPGVWFDFYSEDVFVPDINNVPSEDTAAYLSSFGNLLKFIKQYLPDNFSFTLNRLIDQYDCQEMFDKEFEENLIRLSQDLPGGLPSLTPQQAATVEMNVRATAEQRTDPLWRERAELLHDAYSLASKRRCYYRNESKILVNNTATKCAISVGTTKTSVVKFWVGAGVLVIQNGGYIENILSVSQLSAARYDKETISIKGLTGKNFQQIKVLI